ncbi:MAG TPA: tripartite tricarboxylate transporter substrate binding protein [Burkholderiales bacterium]|nr:tripartite tricarboxylate transporter substrate binding protein [Burkholderiales bacterium]
MQKTWSLIGAIVVSLATLVQVADAQPGAWPAHPIKWIVPVPASGIVDRVARAYGDKLEAALGQAIVVDNRPGANTLIGTQVAAEAPADGLTLLSVTPALVTGAMLYPKANWPADPLQTFTPVSALIKLTNIIVVPASSPYHTIQDLIRAGKAASEPLLYGASSLGSMVHLGMEEFGIRSGVKLKVVPYKGGPPMLTDLLGSNLGLAVDNLSNSLPYIRSGKLRALLVLSENRNTVIPDVPATTDLGMKDFDASGWQGVAVRKGTPQYIVDRLEREFIRISALPEIKRRFEDKGDVIVGSTSAEFTNLIRKQTENQRDLIRKLNISVE